MFANERYEIILDLLVKHRSVTVSELIERFGVSIETIRRDLAHLEKHGKLNRVHGGAVAISERAPDFPDLTVRLDENADKKRELAEYAIRLVHEGDVVALDAGSTTAEIARILCSRFKSLKIITYSKDLVDILSKNAGFEIICLGGVYDAAERLFRGFIAEENLNRLHADIGFVAPFAISYKYGGMLNDLELHNIMRGMLEISDKKYLVADSTKFETTLTVRLCSLNEVDAIITDSALDPGIHRLYREKGIEIIKDIKV